MLQNVITFLHGLLCFAIVALVLLQRSKGADAGAGFGAGASGTCTVELIMITEPPAAVTLPSHVAVASTILVVLGTITTRYRSGGMIASASSSIKS